MRQHQFIRGLVMILLFGGIIFVPARLHAVTIQYQNLTLGPSGALIGGLGDVFNVRGNLIDNSAQNTFWDTHLSRVGFNAAGSHQLTWTATEQGRGNAGFINNFAVGIFVVPSGASLTTSGGGALYTRVLVLGDGISQLNSITGSSLNIHYNPGSPQNAYLNFQTYTLPNGSMLSPAAAPADFNAVWNGTTGNWSDATKWSGNVSPLNPSNSVTLYDASINGGTVTLDQTIGYIQKLNLGSGGTLTGPNSLTPWDTFTWGTAGNNNPSMIGGGAIVNANGDITIVGDSARNLDNATINNHAGYIATWAAGNSDLNFSNNAVFNNNGAFIAQNNRGLGHNGGTGTFNNYGTFTKSTGTGTTHVGSANFVFNDPGSISVQTGTLEFDARLSGPATGSVSISNGAGFVLADGVTTFAGGISNAGALNVGDAIGATSSAVFRLQVNNQISNSSFLTVKSDGLLDLNGLSESVDALVINSGNVSIGTGTLIPSSLTMTGGIISGTGSGKVQLTSGVTAVSDAGSNTAAITAAVDLNGATRTFTINHGPAATDLLVSGNMVNGGVTKGGVGAMTLRGANTYAGGTTVTQGVLNINSPNALGTGAFTVNGVSTIDNTSGAAITLATNNLQVWASNFTFAGTQSINFGTGTVTLNANPTVTVSANTLRVGVIGNGTGNSLTKAGDGTMLLFGGAAYTGTTSANAGTLIVSSGSFDSSATTIAATATMNFVSGANAGNGTFTNNASTLGTVVPGLIQFFDANTTAASGHYTNQGGLGVTTSSSTGGNGAQMIFSSGTTAGNATITNQGATLRGAFSGGQTLFNAGSTAGNATITANGGNDGQSGGPAPGGLTLFSGDATAGNSTLISTGGTFGGVSGSTRFKDTARAGSATITINNGVANNNGTFNDFFDHSTADSAHITANSGTALGFHDSATGGSATLLATGGPSFAPAGSEIDFYNTSTAGNANVTAASNTGVGGLLKFHDNSDAGHGIFTTATIGNAVGSTQFFDSSSAANGVFTTNGGTAGQSAPGAFIQFHNNSTAGSGAFTNNGTASFQANGAEMDFVDTSTAGNAMVTNVGAPDNGNGGITVFSNSSRAGTATFTNTGATAATNGNNGGGYTVFNAGTTADHATFINNGSSFNNATRTSGHTIFNAGSTADHGTFIANGSPTNTGVAGEVDLVNGATAGNGMFTINPGIVSGASGGLVDLSLGGSSGANATFTNNGGTVSGASGGVTIFAANTTAGSALVTANGGTSAGAGGSTIGFFGNPDPANSTLVANGGTNGGAGGLILFIASPQSGQFFPASLVRIVANAGGTFDSSGAGEPLTVGSIEGAGQFLLGGGTLITGALNTDTTVSGIIANGGSQGGSNGKLTKAGTGKLSLTGANAYTGATTVIAGTLQSANNGALATTSSVAVNNAGSMLAVNYGGSTDYTQTQVATLLGKTTFGARSTAFGFDTNNASGAVTYGNGIAIAAGVTKLGPGTLILSGANTYSGGTTVLSGTLKFNINTGAATIGSGVTATVASGATLELAGSVSALGTAGGNRAHIVNDSTSSGVVVSGTNQVVGGIDGSGSTQVNAGSDLTANHVVQTALVIGGTAASPGLMTIDASDASGNPLGQSSGFVLANSLRPSGPFGAPDVSTASTIPVAADSADLAVVALGKSVGSGDPAPVPEPSTLLLAFLAVLGAVSTQFARHQFRCQTA
ncbi:MAG TPA: autotransporter-associated beta strand repeat-containing protein [Pirellulales bacterium]|jgi:autotransporter-associated beta strand protein|nr:autotransporter-associated beta strand repeat-containing protein [Pirellulales bacterium]